MTVRNILAGAAALSLAAAPVAAQAPVAAPTTDASELGGGDLNWVFGVLLVLAVVAGIIIAADSDNDSVTVSV